MEVFFQNILIWIESSKYFLIFLGVIVQVPITTMLSGFLYSLGQLDLFPMYLTLLSGNITADIGWYLIGRFGANKIIFKYGNYIGIKLDKINNIKKYFNLHHKRFIIISKTFSGLGVAIIVLIASGIFKVSFKDYLKCILIGGIFSNIILLSIGYFFGNIFEIMPRSMKFTFTIFLIAITIISIKYINRYIEKKGI